MSISIDLSSLLSYLSSTSNLALSCAGFHRLVRSNGFPIKTSRGCLCLGNLSFYKLLDYPYLDDWTLEEFLKAIKTDDSDQLLLLLKSRANIEARNYEGKTALMWAAEYGKVECLKLLLEHKGANVEEKNNYGNTALMTASKSGKVECLKLLLEHKANIEEKATFETTALHDAAAWNDEAKCLQTLLEHKANIEAKDSYGNTPLIWAATNGKTECLQTLLEQGAQVDPGMRERFPHYAHLWPDPTL